MSFSYLKILHIINCTLTFSHLRTHLPIHVLASAIFYYTHRSSRHRRSRPLGNARLFAQAQASHAANLSLISRRQRMQPLAYHPRHKEPLLSTRTKAEAPNIYPGDSTLACSSPLALRHTDSSSSRGTCAYSKQQVGSWCVCARRRGARRDC